MHSSQAPKRFAILCCSKQELSVSCLIGHCSCPAYLPRHHTPPGLLRHVLVMALAAGGRPVHRPLLMALAAAGRHDHH